MNGYKMILLHIARKAALASGHYLVPTSKPLEWAKEANECERVAAGSESEGLDYGSGYWAGRSVELVRLGNQVVFYNLDPARYVVEFKP